jgi:uncharacterized protein YdhG (YjbR/CyaY superfamily)
MSQSSEKDTQKKSKKEQGFSDVERAAMRERARELKAEARASKDRAAGERDVIAAIDALPEPERAMAARLHQIVSASAPDLMPRTWYGMPAYAKNGKIVCFFQSASKFQSRYSTFGFNDTANLDEGDMWPTAFALKALTPDVEAAIGTLVRKAVSD